MARRITINLGDKTMQITRAEAIDLFFLLLSFLLGEVKEQAED